MKKTIISFVIGVCALTLVFVGCQRNNTDGLSSSLSAASNSPKPVTPALPPSQSFIPVSQLAFKAILFDPKAPIQEVRNMYMAMQRENNTLPDYASNSPIGAAQVTAMYSDLCRCPDGRNLCPCIGDTTLLMAKVYTTAKNTQTKAGESAAMVRFDKQEMKSKIVESKGDSKWVSFVWPANIQEGRHKLTISADFTGTGVRTYELNMEKQGGKLYLKWPQ